MKQCGASWPRASSDSFFKQNVNHVILYTVDSQILQFMASSGVRLDQICPIHQYLRAKLGAAKVKRAHVELLMIIRTYLIHINAASSKRVVINGKTHHLRAQ